MSSDQENIMRHAKRKKSEFEETEQASEPDSDMAMMLEFLGQKLKTTMIK